MDLTISASALPSYKIKRVDSQMETEKMRNALRSIASEMQRFQDATPDQSKINLQSNFPPSALSQHTGNEKVLSELLNSKTKVQNKRARIHKLRRNLKTACFVAKTVVSAKEDESISFNKRLTFARSECADLLERYKSNIDIINSLTRENQILQHKLDNVTNFIQLGYNELQKIRHERIEEASVLFKLRELIISCGEYYANYCNEHDKFVQIEQRNRFLKNKIILLENHIKAISGQLKSLQCCKNRLQKENALMKEKYSESNSFQNVHVAYSEIQVKTKLRMSNEKSNTSEEAGDFNLVSDQLKLDSYHDFELSSHLLLVKKLLSDQATLLRDLQSISKEFHSFQ